MNTDDLALLFDGMANGMQSGLKPTAKTELEKLAAMFRRFPNQTATEFVKFVDDAFGKERNSIPALVERIRAFREGRGEPFNEIWGGIESTKPASNLGKILKGLGAKPGRRKDENLQRLRSLLQGGGSDLPIPSEVPEDKAEKEFREYCSIRDNIATLSLEEIRTRFNAIAAQGKPVMVAVLRKLGYHTSGSKRDLEDRLLGPLEMMKMSQERTKLI